MSQEEIIESGVADIAADLGLGQSEGQEVTESTTEPVAEETAPAPETTEAAPAPVAEATPQPRQAPKAWAKEQHERWAKLDKDTQDYIELREKQIAEGLRGYSEANERLKAWDTAIKDYMPLIQQQGVTPFDATRYMFEAHRQMSTGTPEQRAAFFGKIAKEYGIDLSKINAGTDEPPSVRELRERTERLERERAQERDLAYRSEQEKITKQVSDFADAKDDKGNAKHPYFDECYEDIAALIQAGHTLEQAYEKAVYANPVTRAKELARLRTEEEAALRAKAKKEATDAKKAASTNVNSRDTRRTPTAPTSKRWEDTLDETFKEIQQRNSTH